MTEEILENVGKNESDKGNESGKGNKKRVRKEEKPFSIRAINLKLHPTIEKAELINKEIERFVELHDIGINRYVGLQAPSQEAISEEAKRMRRELRSPECSGTFVDLAIGQKGAESHFRTMRKMARSDINNRDKKIKELEVKNKNLTKLESVWFNPVKNVFGKCAMCGKEGKMFYQSNEQNYKEECLCEVCSVDFFAYREEIKTLKRHIRKNYFLCKDLASRKDLSEGLVKEINRFDRPIGSFKGTVSNKVKIKGGQLKIDFEEKVATIILQTGEKIHERVQVEFSGEHYYKNFPKYGLNAEENKYQKLITDHLVGGGYAFLIRRNKRRNKRDKCGDNDSGDLDLNYEYYLSIPTHYPMQDRKLEVEGCILVSQRKVLLYINGRIKFIELFNPYLKKRIYGGVQTDIQNQNKKLYICNWGNIPQKSRKLLLNLKNKFGFDWVNIHDVTVEKSEDGNTATIVHDEDAKRWIKISLNRGDMTAVLISNDGTSHTLHIIESIKPLEEGKLRKTELYSEPQIPMPEKYTEGNLLKHVRHKNKEVARQVVEEAKKMLSEKGCVVLVNYTYIHTEGQTVTPIISLNDQIENMLRYDSIHKGSVYWSRLKVLKCPNCNREQPERVLGSTRLAIREIFFSDTNSWICEEDECKRKVNSPLIAVAKNIMNGDIEELLKKPTKKEIKEDDLVE